MNFSPVTLLADGAPPTSVRQQPYQDEFLTTVEIGEYGSKFQLTVKTATADNGVAEIASFAASILEAVGTLASAPTQLSDAAEDVTVMLADRRAEIAGVGMTSPKCEHCGHSEWMHTEFGRCREIGCPCRIHREAK